MPLSLIPVKGWYKLVEAVFRIEIEAALFPFVGFTGTCNVSDY